MKKSIFKSFVALLVLLFVGVYAFSQSDEQLKQKIESINKEMAKNMIEGNYEAGLKNYASDAISLPNNSKMVQGIDAIKQSNQAMMQSGAKFKTFETKIMQVKSCGNQITEIGTYNMSMTIPGMATDYVDNGKYMTVWEKQPDGSLKIKMEMWNTDVNPMAGGTM